jgi:hypothetical protein
MKFLLHVTCNAYAKSGANQREKFPPAAKSLTVSPFRLHTVFKVAPGTSGQLNCSGNKGGGAPAMRVLAAMLTFDSLN